MLKFPRNPKDYPKLKIKNIESKASPGIKSLMFKSIVLGETDDYVTYIQFFKVDYSDTKDKDFLVPAKVEGRLKYYKKPGVSSNPVFLKCSCPDFRFKWEKSLYDNQGLLGNFRRYTKVSGSTRPPANPDNLMGVCKHLWNFLGSLRDTGQITE